MLTPAFELSQDKDFLTIIIKAPFTKISETEIFVEENDFKFFSKPYFLRLTLPGNLVEDGREKADYDVDKGTFTVCFPKETAGEHFEGLDMLTKLLAPKGSTSAAAPLIQVVDEAADEEGGASSSIPDSVEATGEEEEKEEFDWSIPQTPYTEEPILAGAPTYGFASQKSGVFKRLQEELCGIVDCPEPDSLPVEERRGRRRLGEQAKFDEDYYLTDLCEDDMIRPLIDFNTPWMSELDSVQNGCDIQLAVELSEEEKEQMRKLPRKEYILDPAEETQVWLGLVDIIFAYAYNCRSNMGDNNVESGWTISKISATLSWLEVFNNLQEVLVTCYRRSLCFPLHRHWGLSSAVLDDVVTIFKLGRRRLLKCLLEIHTVLQDQESRYILNDLYITDYCVWIQGARSKRIESLADSLAKARVTKDEVELGVVEAESLLNMVDNVNTLTQQMGQVTVADDDLYEGESDVETDSSDECTDDDDITDSDDIKTEDDEVVEGVAAINIEAENNNINENGMCSELTGKGMGVMLQGGQDQESVQSKDTGSKPLKPLITVIE